MKYLKKILLTINVLLVVGLLFAYLSPETNPNDNWLYAFFGVFYPILLLASLLMILIWILVDYKYIFISLIGIALGWQHLTGFVNFSSPPKQNPDITIMSYNLSHGYSIRDKDQKAQEKKVKIFNNYLSSLETPDIFCLQESSYFIKSIFKKKYPSFFLYEIENKGAILYSKYPLAGGGKVEFGTKTNSCIYADIIVKKDTIRIYNLHLQSNSISKDAEEVLENTDLKQPETWSSIRSIMSKYKSASLKRSIQAELVKTHAKTSPYPVIICGDVNDPPTSYSYNILSNGMQDAFHEKGSGIGTTYGGSIPMLRIDYILSDPSFELFSYHCKKEKFSDHYPIFASLKIK